MSAAATTDWAEVYKSIDIEVLKRVQKWMTIAIPVVGALPVAAAFLVFRHQPGIGVMLAVVITFFSVKQAWKLHLLNRNPKVYCGPIVRKSTLSYTQHEASSRTEKFFIRIMPEEAFEIDIRGKADPLPESAKNVKLECSEELYSKLSEGQFITALILPHEKSVFRLFPNPKNQ